MGRCPFRKRLRQQSASKLVNDFAQDTCVEDLIIDHRVPAWIPSTRPMDLDAPPELFGPQSSMNKPLLEPHRLERPRCHLRDQGEDVCRAEGDKSLLRTRVYVGIARI